MKKVLVIILAAILMLGMCGCGESRGKGSGIAFEQSTLTLEIDETREVSVSFNAEWTDASVEWKADDPLIVRVYVRSQLLQTMARLTGLKEGTTTVTATASDGSSARLQVTVTAAEAEDDNPDETPEAPAEALAFTQEVISLGVEESAALPIENAEGARFTSSDESIVTVTESGEVRGVSAGVGYITANNGTDAATIKIGVLESKDKTVTLTQAQDERINIYGRTKYDTSRTAQMLYFTASGYDVTFYGTQIRATMIRETSDSTIAWLSVFVDGEDMTKEPQSDRIIKLTSSSATEYTLASGLVEGWHTVKVRKRTAYQRGSTKMDTVGLRSIATDGYIGYTADKGALKIHVYGDSFSCGYGNLTDGGSMTSENTDGNLAYHSLLANSIGADLTVMAASGWGMYKGYGGESSWSWASKYDKLNTTSTEAYTAGGADVIIINLGTNDVSASVFPSETEQFKAAYTTMLNGLRDANPDAYIFCTYGFCSTNANCKTAIQEVVNAAANAKTKAYFYTTVRAASGGHPDVANHRNGAAELKALLQTNGIID